MNTLNKERLMASFKNSLKTQLMILEMIPISLMMNNINVKNLVTSNKQNQTKCTL